MPLEQPESDQQVTGSTFVGFPTVIAGVYFGSGNVGSLPAYVQTFLLDPSGALYITTSGSVSVASPPGMLWPAGPTQIFTSGPQAVSGTIGVNNFPATQNVSGNVGAVIQNWPAAMGISASAVLPVAINNWPATIGVTGSTALRVWDGGVQGITASAVLPVDINNWPAIHGVSSSSPSGFWQNGVEAVSGSQLTGSTFNGFPVAVGGVYYGPGNVGVLPAYLRAIQTDASGAIYVTVTGSLPVAISNITIASGSLAVCGTTASGSTQVDPPISVAGVDNTGIIRTVLTDNIGRIITAPAGSNTVNGFSYGTVTTTATTNVAILASTYNEQTGSAQRSIHSANASDTLAGTGAQKVTITYYDSSYSGPFTETIALSGSTWNNTVNTNICFIEKIVVSQVGTDGFNDGIITLNVGINGNNSTLATMNANDNETFWAQHYTPTGKTTYITGMTGNNNNSSNTVLLSIKARSSGSNQPENLVSDTLSEGGGVAQTVRSFGTPLKITGPARIRMFGAPSGTPSIINRASFDFYDQ